MKSGFISIIGRPNVGKSTLLNQIINEHVAITSNKAGTTRNIIEGIYNEENTQIVFVDTPGIHSVGGDEAERTYAYLSNLDAAVFCVTATDGTLNKSAVDFLLNNVPSMIRNRIVFAITHADKKAENANLALAR